MGPEETKSWKDARVTSYTKARSWKGQQAVEGRKFRRQKISITATG